MARLLGRKPKATPGLSNQPMYLMNPVYAVNPPRDALRATIGPAASWVMVSGQKRDLLGHLHPYTRAKLPSGADPGQPWRY